MATYVEALQKVLGAQFLTTLVTKVEGGVPNPFGDQWFTTGRRDVFTDFASYRKVSNTRQVAQGVAYGAASVAAPMMDIEEVGVKLAHCAENQQFSQLLFQALQGFASPMPQRMAEDEITRQTKELKRRVTNRRIAMLASMLALGKIYLDKKGNLLYSASNAFRTIDFGIPADATAGYQLGTGSNVIARVRTVTGNMCDAFASWATASTDISGVIEAIKVASVMTTGRELETVYYGNLIRKYFLENTDMMALIKRSGYSREEILQKGALPETMLGLRWKPAYGAFFEDSNGTKRTWWGASQCCFVPAVDDSWYEFLEGSYAIPENIGGVGQDAAQMLGNVRQVHGEFSYATITADPIGIKQVVGDTSLSCIRHGPVIWNMTDVTA